MGIMGERGSCDHVDSMGIMGEWWSCDHVDSMVIMGEWWSCDHVRVTSTGNTASRNRYAVEVFELGSQGARTTQAERKRPLALRLLVSRVNPVSSPPSRRGSGVPQHDQERPRRARCRGDYGMHHGAGAGRVRLQTPDPPTLTSAHVASGRAR